MREHWINNRKSDLTPTQLYYAKNGIITEEMCYVAKMENLKEEFVREEIASGRLIIPANINHTNLTPIGIGRACRCKINTNIGSNTLSMGLQEKLEKLSTSIECGADVIMDLNTVSDPEEIRMSIIKNSHIPIGTSPIYQIIHDIGDLDDLDIDIILKYLQKQANQGVSYFSLQAGLLQKFIPLVADRKLDIVSKDGNLMANLMMKYNIENPFYLAFDDILDICAKHDIVISLNNSLRPSCLHDASDEAQISELKILGDLVLRARKKSVQVMVEGLGHIPLNQIEYSVKLEQELCHEAPFYVIDSFPTDISMGYDHITSSIGGTMAAFYGASMIYCATPKEHIGLPNARDLREGIIAHKIGAHIADIALKRPGAINRDNDMINARYSFNWDKQFELSFDPQRAKKYHDESLYKVD